MHGMPSPRSVSSARRLLRWNGVSAPSSAPSAENWITRTFARAQASKSAAGARTRAASNDCAPALPLNGPSQWVWGSRAPCEDGSGIRHTLVGYAIHHLASVFCGACDRGRYFTSTRLSSGSRSMSLLTGSMPAFSGRPATCTVMVDSPERTRCFAR